MPGQFGFELSPEDIASASDKTQQQVSPSFSSMAGELAPVPWWKRKLRQMQEGNPAQAAGQAVQGGGSDPVDSWESLGKGVGNLARMFIPFEQGGAVQGPTMAMIGEGGEPEYVVPESKTLPFAMRTLQDGIPPNPATLPRTEHRPPPPVILGNTPAMACGGKVIPKMADGGKINPSEEFFRQANPYFQANELPMRSIMDAPGDFGPSVPAMLPPRPQPPILQAPPTNPAQQAPAVGSTQSASPIQMTAPQVQLKLAEMMRNRPIPKWYERPFMGNGGQLDLRPGVAGYSQAGRALGNVIGAVLPFNRKNDAWNRDYSATQAESAAAQAKDAAAIKQQELEQRGRVADAQVASSRATEALRNKQAAAMDAPAPRKLRVTDYTNAETGDVTRVWNDENTGDEVKREVLGGVAKPKPTAQGERNPTAASLAATAADPNATPEQRAAAENALKLLKPPKVAGVGAATPTNPSGLSDEDERLAQAIADGIYSPTAIPVGKDGKKKAILARAAELGYEGGGQSASDAKLGGIVETLPNELEKLRGIVRSGYRGMVAGYQSGTNREVVRLIDNIADKVGRLRSGGAINKDEEARFLRQLGTDKADLLFGSAAEAEKAIDGVLAEAQAVSGRMKKPARSSGAQQQSGQRTTPAPAGRQVRDKRTGEVRTLKPGQDVSAFTKQYPQFEAVTAKGRE